MGSCLHCLREEIIWMPPSCCIHKLWCVCWHFQKWQSLYWLIQAQKKCRHAVNLDINCHLRRLISCSSMWRFNTENTNVHFNIKQGGEYNHFLAMLFSYGYHLNAKPSLYVNSPQDFTTSRVPFEGSIIYCSFKVFMFKRGWKMIIMMLCGTDTSNFQPMVLLWVLIRLKMKVDLRVGQKRLVGSVLVLEENNWISIWFLWILDSQGPKYLYILGVYSS